MSLDRPLIIVWAVLCATTVLSAAFASDASASLLGAAAVLGAAFAKCYLVMHYFMELDHAPWPWRAPFIAWCALVFLLLVGLTLL